MMTAPLAQESAVQHIKERADIVEVVGEHVSLTRAGINLKGLCPFHVEKTPSFIVNPSKQSFKCFGCGEGGDVITFVMKYHGLPFPEAMKELAGRYNVPLQNDGISPEERRRAREREILAEACERAASMFHEHLVAGKDGEGARKYLAARGMRGGIIEEFTLGYAPESWNFLLKGLGSSFSEEILLRAGLVIRGAKGSLYDRFRGRIIFPIFNHKGRIVGFGGRILGEGEPKYLNTPETPIFNKGKLLYGFFQTREEVRKKRQALIVEGNFDLLSLVAGGLRNVVAPLGTSLTVNHIRIIKRYAEEAVLLFDGDEAGCKAAMRAAPHLLAEKLRGRVVMLPENHDPDSFIRQFGGDQLEEKIKDGAELSEFVLERLTRQYGLSLEGKTKIVEELRKIIEVFRDDAVERALFVSHFSERLGFSPHYFTKVGKKSPSREEPPLPPPINEREAMPIREKQLLQFVILYPEYLQDFVSAGIRETFQNTLALDILDTLQALAEGNGAADPEFLLDSMEPGPARSFISHTLGDMSGHCEENRAAEAEEKLEWLKKNRLRKQKENLLREIEEAQKGDNFKLLVELMTKKKNLDEKN